MERRKRRGWKRERKGGREMGMMQIKMCPLAHGEFKMQKRDHRLRVFVTVRGKRESVM
jgi:hypothetical protein